MAAYYTTVPCKPPLPYAHVTLTDRIGLTLGPPVEPVVDLATGQLTAAGEYFAANPEKFPSSGRILEYARLIGLHEPAPKGWSPVG